MHQAFCNGGFVVHKHMTMQAREQCNAMVKGNGGAVGLASNPGALRRWLTAGPQVARLLKSFEHSMTSKRADCMDHHEQSHAPQKAFS